MDTQLDGVGGREHTLKIPQTYDTIGNAANIRTIVIRELFIPQNQSSFRLENSDLVDPFEHKFTWLDPKST